MFDNEAIPRGLGLDFFDTPEDFDDGLTGMHSSVPARIMLIGGNNAAATCDFKCGGIHATGNTNKFW